MYPLFEKGFYSDCTVTHGASVGGMCWGVLLQGKAQKGEITIGDAINLAILEEMLRDPMTTIHAEDLQVRFLDFLKLLHHCCTFVFYFIYFVRSIYKNTNYDYKVLRMSAWIGWKKYVYFLNLVQDVFVQREW